VIVSSIEKEAMMITPASLADWVVFAGMLGSLATFAALGHRWTLEDVTEPVRSHPLSVEVRPIVVPSARASR
jgi:hypothetical protein